MSTATLGVTFPLDATGRRSTTATARAVVSGALRKVDPAGAAAAEHERAWRSGYQVHYRRLVDAGLSCPDTWTAIAASGLAAIHDQMVVVDGDGIEAPALSVLGAPASRVLRTVEVRGSAPPERELAIPYGGRHLRGEALRAQLAQWVADGVMEPSAADAVGDVIDNPSWLALPGRTVVVLGAGAEMGPLHILLRWGATVAAVDLPRGPLWQRVLDNAHESAGRLLVPLEPAGEDDAFTSHDGLAERAGVDLLTEVPAVADWLLGIGGPLVLGNYLYADSATHVRVSVASDLLAQRLQRATSDLALVYLATPTDVFVVPREAVKGSAEARTRRSTATRVATRLLRWVSGGRLLALAYAPDADPGICDALVSVQGPNYALAKRIQRWRATVARSEGLMVSFHVAPSSRTKSVVKNRALEAAFAGAHHFGVEIFDPETANALMAALMVSDLHADRAPQAHPWQDEAHGAVHGGLWRAPFTPRSGLGLAAIAGYRQTLLRRHGDLETRPSA